MIDPELKENESTFMVSQITLRQSDMIEDEIDISDHPGVEGIDVPAEEFIREITQSDCGDHD